MWVVSIVWYAADVAYTSCGRTAGNAAYINVAQAGRAVQDIV
jgi:hypothetical protein